MNYRVLKETRNYTIILWPSESLNIDECQYLHDAGFRPVYAEMRGQEMEVLCEVINIYGTQGLH